MFTPKEFPSNLDKNPFIIMESRSSHLWLSILSLSLGGVFLYTQYTAKTNDSSVFGWIVLSILNVFGIYNFYHCINPQAIAILDEKGLWSKKSGLTNWENIEYYYTVSRYSGRVRTLDFYYKIKDREKEIKIDLTLSKYDNEGTIRRYIEVLKGDAKIEDSGMQ